MVKPVTKCRFWLLDVNYEVKDHQPEIWLWGIDEQGRRILVIDRGFPAYFYVLPESGEDVVRVAERIKAAKTILPFFLNLEVVDRRFFGKPIKAIRVYFQDPELIPEYVKNISKIKGVESCLEDDIRYSMRYLIDNEIVPCGWHEVEAEEIPNTMGIQAEKIFLAASRPKHLPEIIKTPDLRIMSFSIVSYSKKGSPKPEKNPVIIISIATNTGEEKQFVAESSNDDSGIIGDFIKYVRDFDPDIIVGFESNRKDIPYLIARAKKNGLTLKIDRANTEPHTSTYGHMSITGRANVDIFDYVDEFPEVKVKTLENISDYLGVMRISERTVIEDFEVAQYWEDENKRPLLLKFSMENAKCLMGIMERIIDFAIQLSSLVGLPLDHVGTAAVGFRVEWFLIRHAYHIGELIPKRVERPYIPYAGAIVLEPKPGIHENIAVLDFKSMYPSIMIAFNVSPDTYVSPGEPEPPAGVYVAPEVNHKFRKEPHGFYREVLLKLIEARDQIREDLKKINPKSPEYKILDARQKAIKVIANATYGYAGWIGARWYLKPVAEAVTAWGRHTIMSTIKMAKSLGLDVVYGDTDSIFVKNDLEKIDKLSKMVQENLGLEIKPDKIYVRILFTEAKKRYCGLMPDGRLDMVGLEVVRGDWANVAKEIQEKVLEIILKEQSIKRATEYVRNYITSLREKKIPFKDLIIWKTLTKPIDEYEVKTPHVEAAKLLLKEGWTLDVGDKVGFVITLGSGKLYERAKPYILASYDDIDIEYYVTNQVIPAALRILALFNVKESDLLPSKAFKSQTLFDFLGKSRA
ncbi:MAG: DNA polymerase domain-containing protein [Candidatus Bathyarchaeia archaeon]|nr:DNA polymerase II [Candidatus Bathyarchaeota archaeon]